MQVESALALIFLLELSVLAMVMLARYHTAARTALSPRWHWVTRWDFTPENLGGDGGGRVLLISIAGLFLELLMIRWISSEVRIFAYFKNFVLIACYLGFGLGCYVSRRPINLLAMVFPLVTLTLLITLPWPPLRGILAELPTVIGAFSDVDVFGRPTLPGGIGSLLLLAAAVTVVVPLFALTAFVFVPIGQMVGWYLEHAKNGLRAYSINVAGSLVGILLYTGLCFFAQPPPVWFLGSAGLFALLLRRQPRLAVVGGGALLACAGLATLGPGGESRVLWSPYQKLTITPIREHGRISLYQLQTNDSWYQHIIDLSPASVAAQPDRFPGDAAAWNAYNIPYRFGVAPRKVLVLGAGTGNDVAAALRNGAERVVAVEIDPLILQLGRELHFEHPYSSNRVQVVLDDARAYLQASHERFDLILFSLLDSHTTSSHYTNIRIDNYVYTREALAAASRLLAPEGLFVVKFQVHTPWIAGRLHRLLSTVFQHPPMHLESEVDAERTEGRFFVAGATHLLQAAAADPKLTQYTSWPDSLPLVPATMTTDDWPYFYQHEPGLPSSVLVISAVLIVLGWRLVRRIVPPSGAFHLRLFLLGAGFLLLEAQIVSKMALLFGTTWVVNSIVIAVLLGLILAANAVVARWPTVPLAAGYLGIFGTAALAYLVPVDAMLFPSLVLRILSGTVVLCLPVFFAGIVFARSFAEAGFQSEALGANLLGALVGGLLESLSLWTGLRSLVLIAAFLYAVSWIARGRPGREATSWLASRPAA